VSSPLTQHIEKLDTATFPSIDILEIILDIIGKVLTSKMQERNLWDQPPILLGYSDHQAWNKKDAFSDIKIDCYEYAVLRRYQSLKAQTLIKENIDGLVFLNIDHFLLERQKAHDPEGYAIFKNVEAVLQNLSESGSITIDNPQDKKKIRNETVCRLAVQNDKICFPDSIALKQIMASYPEYETIVNDSIKISKKAQQRLSSLIVHLKKEGTAVFRVRDLVEVLKKASRIVSSEVSSSDFEKDFHKELSEMMVSSDRETEAGIDAVGMHEKLKKEIDKLKKHNKVKCRLHLLLTVMLNRFANDEDDSTTDIAREMGESKSTISEDRKLLKYLAEKL